MNYIVIEKHGGWEYAAIVTDQEGNVKIFDKLEDAEIEAFDCQDGIVVSDTKILWAARPVRVQLPPWAQKI